MLLEDCTPAALAAAVPLAHPRLHLTPATLAALGAVLRDPLPAAPAARTDVLRLRAVVASVRDACAALGPPPPPIQIGAEVYIPGAAAWEVRYLAEGEAGFVRAREDGAAAATAQTAGQLAVAALGHALLGAARVISDCHFREQLLNMIGNLV